MLAEYIEKLCDDDRTVLKYIREKDLTKDDNKDFLFDENSDEDSDEDREDSFVGWKIRNAVDQAKEIMYSLVASVRDDTYYHTFKRLDLENPDMKRLYADLEAKIKNADSSYFKLLKYLYENAPKAWLEDYE